MRNCFRENFSSHKKGTLHWSKKTLVSPASNLLTPCFPILVIDHRIFNRELYLPRQVVMCCAACMHAQYVERNLPENYKIAKKISTKKELSLLYYEDQQVKFEWKKICLYKSFWPQSILFLKNYTHCSQFGLISPKSTPKRVNCTSQSWISLDQDLKY